MSNFPRPMITQKGLNLIAMAQAGDKLIFTRGKYGDGNLSMVGEPPQVEDVTLLEDLKNTRVSMGIYSIENPKKGTVRVAVVLDKESLNYGFRGTEIGLFAKLRDDGEEILFCYSHPGADSDFIGPGLAAGGSFYSEFFYFDITVGNAENVTVILDQSVIYAKKEDMEAHNIDPDAHQDIRDKFGDLETSIIEVINSMGYMPIGDVRQTMIVDNNEVIANGAILSRTTFSHLWSALSSPNSKWRIVSDAVWNSGDRYTFSSGDGLTTFRLPDLRGVFIRNYDNGRGLDPAGAGRLISSFQGSDNLSHTHAAVMRRSHTDGGSDGAGGYTSNSTISFGTTASGGVESRPVNVNMIPVIRYK